MKQMRNNSFTNFCIFSTSWLNKELQLPEWTEERDGKKLVILSAYMYNGSYHLKNEKRAKIDG